MGPDILIPLSLFAAIFGIVYLFVSTRNKERLALIEKGADASIFMSGKQNGIPTGRIIILNLALLLMGIGVGAFIALLLSTYTSLHEDAIYPAAIFTTAGIGLFVGFHMAGNLEKRQS